MAFRPIQTRERLIAWGVALVLLALSFVQLVRLLRTPLGPATVIEAIFLAITLGLLAVLLYRLWVLHDLDYWVDRDAVRVLHAGDTVIIPLGDIQKVEYAPQWLGVKPRWLRWPNQWIHPLRPNQDIGAYATCPPAESLALSTTAGALVISPQDADGFRSALEARQKMGPARQLQPAVETSTFKQHWLLHDRPVQVLIGAGLLLGLILLAYLIWHYPQLPEVIPLHFDANGVPDRIANRRSIFLLPSITLLIWFFNTLVGLVLYERERLISYMLWAIALLLQVAGLAIAQKLLELITG